MCYEHSIPKDSYVILKKIIGMANAFKFEL